MLTSIDNFNNISSNSLPLDDNQVGFDEFGSEIIDWVSLLSGPINSQNPSVKRVRDGEHNVGEKKMKVGRKKKDTTPRVAFHTRSVDDILDDGFRWRKYGQKAVKNCIHQRSYYRCTQPTCTVKKQIQRLSKDSRIVVTTYEGIHNHPSEKVMETLSPLLRQLQFLSRI
ncbi:WRKY DNA-binding protein 24 [Euphorbia peplus]|nr:WRKY DNA-binding protein 24 [Euphorbia peplus]